MRLMDVATKRADVSILTVCAWIDEAPREDDVELRIELELV